MTEQQKHYFAVWQRANVVTPRMTEEQIKARVKVLKDEQESRPSLFDAEVAENFKGWMKRWLGGVN